MINSKNQTTAKPYQKSLEIFCYRIKFKGKIKKYGYLNLVKNSEHKKDNLKK